MDLSPAMQKFVLHWGEMGTEWGINRSVSQIHALLYIAEKPLDAEEISSTLKLARSNVSTSIRELLTWRIIKPVSVIGDRREYFESLTDVWELFRIILEERKRREIDPTLQVLNECVAGLKDEDQAHVGERVGNLLEFLNTMSDCYTKFNALSGDEMKQMVELGALLGQD